MSRSYKRIPWYKDHSRGMKKRVPDNVWCEHHGIKQSTFYNAVTRLRKKACVIPEPSKTAYIMDITSHQDVVRMQRDICPDAYPDAT